MRQVVTEGDVPAGGLLRVAAGTLITPSAWDAIRARGVQVVEVSAAGLAGAEKTLALGIKPLLTELGYTVTDVGVAEEKPVDYPDIAFAVAELVAKGTVAWGVVVDGAGIGSAMAANKVPGVRAALCYDAATARNSREHNHANVLTLGGRMLSQAQAEEVLRTWLATPWGGGRHQGRIDKITAIEERFSKRTR